MHNSDVRELSEVRGSVDLSPTVWSCVDLRQTRGGDRASHPPAGSRVFCLSVAPAQGRPAGPRIIRSDNAGTTRVSATSTSTPTSRYHVEARRPFEATQINVRTSTTCIPAPLAASSPKSVSS